MTVSALPWRCVSSEVCAATRRCPETLEIMTVDLDHVAADAAESSWMIPEGTTMIDIPVVVAGTVVGLLECSHAEPTPWSCVPSRHTPCR